MLLFILKTLRHLGIDQEKEPIFLIGSSYGALLAVHLVDTFPRMFRAFSLMVPFFKAKGSTFDRYQWLFSAIKPFRPEFPINKAPPKERIERASFYYSDKNALRTIPVTSLKTLKANQLRAREELAQTTVPLILVTAG